MNSLIAAVKRIEANEVKVADTASDDFRDKFAAIYGPKPTKQKKPTNEQTPPAGTMVDGERLPDDGEVPGTSQETPGTPQEREGTTTPDEDTPAQRKPAKGRKTGKFGASAKKRANKGRGIRLGAGE